MDWTGGLTLKIIFMLSNGTHSHVGLCGGTAALFLVIYTVPEQITNYRIAGYFRGVLIFVIFVTSPGVTKFCTHEVFHLRNKLLVLLLR